MAAITRRPSDPMPVSAAAGIPVVLSRAVRTVLCEAMSVCSRVPASPVEQRQLLNQANNLIVLDGNVRLRDQGLLVLGEVAHACRSIPGEKPAFDSPLYVCHDARARGYSTKLMRRDELRLLSWTTAPTPPCEPGENTSGDYNKQGIES